MVRKWFCRRSLRGKMIASFCVLWILIGCIFLLFCKQTITDIQRENIRYMTQLNENINTLLTTILTSADQLKSIQMYDEKYKSILRENNRELPIHQRWENIRYMERAMKHAVEFNPNIIRATIIAEDETYSTLGYVSDEYRSRIVDIAEKTQLDSIGKTVYLEVFEEEIDLLKYGVVTMLSYLYDYSTKRCLGLLAVDINFSTICEVLDDGAKKADSTGIAVLNDHGLIYQSPSSKMSLNDDPELLERFRNQTRNFLMGNDTFQRIKIDQGYYLLTAIQNDTSGWSIIQYQSENALYENAFNSMRDILYLMIGLAVVFLVVSYLLAYFISQPLKVIDDTISKSKNGHLELIPDNTATYENDVGRLIQNYNEMVICINESKEKEIASEIAKQKLRMQMLRYQINPHFLYNTLNTIHSIGCIEGIDSVCQVAGSLSRIMRYNVKGGEIVQVSQELQNARDYLAIQMIRFQDMFTVEFFVQEGLESMSMLKFLLQPMLENAINHGLKNVRTGGKIGINVFSEKDDLKIVIWDNGNQMSEQDVTYWNHILESENASYVPGDEFDEAEWETIGLRNVNARIKGFYGSDYGVHIEKKNGNTEVYLDLKRIDSERS